MPSVANYYEESLVLESGSGLHVRDVDGREYLDFFGGILTVSVGHCDPRVTGAINAQIDRLGPRLHPLSPTLPIVELAETARAHHAGPARRSRSSRRRAPMRTRPPFVLAQVYTGAMEIIALRHGYSGRSMLAQSLTAHSTWRAVPSQVAARQARASSPYCYRCPLGSHVSQLRHQVRADIEELIQTTTTGRIAGFLAEPIQGVGGFITPPREYFEIAVEIVRKLRRRVHLRRGADRLRPHRRQDVRHRALGRRARHHDDGEGHRERDAARA